MATLDEIRDQARSYAAEYSPSGGPLDQYMNDQLAEAPKPNEDPEGFLGWSIDILSRGQYAAAGAVSELMSNSMFTPNSSVLGDAAVTAVQEFFAPQKRLSFTDIIKRQSPKFAHENPIGARVLGFIGDVALDPLTYVSFGAAAGAKVALKPASVGAAKGLAQLGITKGGKVTLSKLGRRKAAELAEAELATRLSHTKPVREAYDKIVSHLVHDKHFEVEDAAELAVNQFRAIAKAPKKGLARFNRKYGLDLGMHDVTAFDQGADLVTAYDQGMSKLSTIIMDDLLSTGKSALVDEGGIKLFGKSVVKGHQLAKVSEKLHIPQFRSWVSDTKVGTAFRFGFTKSPKEIPPEIAKMEKNFLRRLSEGERRVLEGVTTLHQGLPKESRYAVGVTLKYLDDFEQAIRKDLSSDTYLASTSAPALRWLNREEAAEYGARKMLLSKGQLKAKDVLQDDFLRRVIARNTEDFLNSPVKQREMMKAEVEKLSGTLNTAEGKRIQSLFEKRGTGGLTHAERSMLAVFRDDMQRLGKLEVEGRILKGMKENYFPRYYDMARDPKQFTSMLGRLRAGLVSTFSPNESRHFKTLDEAMKAGYDPIFDVAQLYAMRVSDHYEQLAKVEFADALVQLVPDLQGKLGKFGAKIADEKISTELFDGTHISIQRATKELKKSTDDYSRQLGHILERVRFIGNPMYDPLNTKMKNDMLKIYDKALSFFRSSATVLRPAFGARNAVSNQFQMFLGGGLQGIRHANVFVDPRASLDSLALLRAHGDPSILRKMRPLKTVFGKEYSPHQVMQAALDHHIVRNISVEGIGAGPVSNLRMSRNLVKQLDRQAAVGNKIPVGTPGAEGIKKLFSGSLNYWDVPAMIEDHSRLTLFRNMLASGYDPKSAAEFVEEALFDYTHGLSKFETRVMRRLIPFYSFQRFAVPLVGRMTGRSVGRVPNAAKIGSALMDVWGKVHTQDELTPSERAAVPGFLLEQPHVFTGFEKDMKANFHVFNNFTPLDVLSFIEADEETGGIDFHKSLINGALAQMTPMLKVPLEMMLNKNLFTGRALDGTAKQGEMDVDKLFGNLVAAATAQVGQVAGIPASTAAIPGAQLLGQKLASLAPDAAVGMMKVLLGYEEGIDPRTGERTVYMSPWRLHLITSALPGMNEAIRGGRSDKSATEKAYRLMFGVSVQKRNLQQDAQMNQYLKQRTAQDKKAELRQAIRNNQESTAKAKYIELQHFLREWAGHTQILQSGPIRGPQDTGGAP